MALANKGDSQQQHAYEIEGEIGKGAYGTVYKARDIKNQGKYVALKEIRILTRSDEGMPMSTIREIAILQQMEKFEHPNIIRLLDVWTRRLTHQELKLILVFEHMAQDLAQYLEKSPSCGLSPDNIKDIMHQLVNGVDFLHTNRIIHRDLKPQNILLSSQGCVKIADFGLARIYSFHMSLTSVVVTLYYRSPEVLLQDSYCSAVDVWSCGTILAELYLRKPLFQGTSEIDQLCKIFNLMGLPPADQWPATTSLPRSSFKDVPKQSLRNHIPNIDPQAVELLEKMLIFDQRKRITIVEILKDPWFTEDGDVSMSSLSSDSVSLNASDSSVDNMEAGSLPSDKLGTVVRSLGAIPSLNVVNNGNVLSDTTLGTESSIVTNQNTHFQRVAQSRTYSGTTGYSTSLGVPSQNGSAVIDKLPVITDVPTQFTSSGPYACTINTSTSVHDSCKAVSGNHFRELYQPSSCSNSQMKPSGQLVSTGSHIRAPCKPSATTTSQLSKSYNHEQDKQLLAGVSHLSKSFKPLTTTASCFQQPAPSTATHYKEQCHGAASTTTHQQQYQRPIPVSGQLPEGSMPSTSTAVVDKMKPLQTLAIPSSTTNVVLVKSDHFCNVPVMSNCSFSKTAHDSAPLTRNPMTEYRIVNGKSIADTDHAQNVNIHHQANLRHTDPAVEGTQYGQDTGYSEPYGEHGDYNSNVLAAHTDDTGVKKGIKRSRPH